MKKVLVFVLISLLLFSLVSAKLGLTSHSVNDLNESKNSGNGNQENNQEENQGNDTQNQEQNQEENELGKQLGNITQEKNRIRTDASGECPKNCTCTGSATKCMLDNGTREMTVHAGKSGNIIIQSKEINASTNVTLYKSDDGKLYGVFRNNKTMEIKMLPHQVQERMRERLQKQLENETIELSEDGEYKYEAKERAKLFAVFPVKLKVSAEVNSEDGEIVRLNKPWWTFLAKGEESEQLLGASCGTVTPGYNDACCQDKGYDVWNSETAECEFNSE